MAGTLDIIASVIAGAMALGAVGIAARGLWGDRARGRKRCPGCWYDMSAAKAAERGNADAPSASTTDAGDMSAAPLPTAARLTCPECGRASLPRELTRTRRRWVRAASALLILLPLAHVTSVQSHIRAEGWTGLVPNWALIAGIVLLPGEGQDVFERVGPTIAAAPPPSAVTWVRQTWSARARANRRWLWERTVYGWAHDIVLTRLPDGDPRIDSWRFGSGRQYGDPRSAPRLSFLTPLDASHVTPRAPGAMLHGIDANIYVTVSPIEGRWWAVDLHATLPDNGETMSFVPRNAERALSTLGMRMPFQGTTAKITTVMQHFVVQAPRGGGEVEFLLQRTTADGRVVHEQIAARVRLPDMDRPLPTPLPPRDVGPLAPRLAAWLDPLAPTMSRVTMTFDAYADAAFRDAPLVLRAELLRDGVRHSIGTLVAPPDRSPLATRVEWPTYLTEGVADFSGAWTLRLTGDDRLTSVFPDATSYWAGTIEIPVTVRPPQPTPALPAPPTQRPR